MEYVLNGSWLTTEFFGGAASAITIVLFLFGAINFLRNKRKKIYYQGERTVLVPKGLPEVVDISISHNSNTGESLVRDHILIINKTDQAVDDTFFLETPFSIPRLPGVVYSVETLQLNDVGSCSVEIDDNKIQIKNLSLPKFRGLAFEILHDGCVGESIISHPKAKIEVAQYKYAEPQARFWYSAPIISSILLVTFFATRAIHELQNGWPDAYSELDLRFIAPIPIFIILTFIVGFFDEKYLNPIITSFQSQRLEGEFNQRLGSERKS